MYRLNVFNAVATLYLIMVSFASFNVRGLRDNKKRAKVFKFLKSSIFDVVLLQETHAVKRDQKFWKTCWGGQAFFANGTTNSKGCMLLIKRHIKTTTHRVVADKEGRYLIVDISIKGRRMTVANIYAPNLDAPHFFVECFQEIAKIENEDIIIVGDMNTTLECLDKRGGNSTEPGHPKSTKVIKMFMENMGLIDIWRERHKKQTRFTWFRGKPNLIMERLDYFLVSGSVSNIVTITDIEPSFMSDHSIPFIACKIQSVEYGPGYWKIDSELLDDTNYCEEIKSIIKQNCTEFSDVKMCWEMIKLDTRGDSIKIKRRKKKSIQNKIDVLRCKQYRLQCELESGSPSLFEDTERQLNLVTKRFRRIDSKTGHFF